MARPVREIADAINRQDAKWLSTLPGIGATTAEQIVTTLKRKVTRFLMAPHAPDAEPRAGGGRRPQPKAIGQDARRPRRRSRWRSSPPRTAG